MLLVLTGSVVNAEQHKNNDDELPVGSTLELIAPLDAEFKNFDRTIVVFDYFILVDKFTRYYNLKEKQVKRFVARKKQWVAVIAKKLPDGKLSALSITLSDPRPMSLLVLENNFDRKFIPKNTKDRRQPLKSFLEDESESVAFKFRPTENIWFGGNFDYEWREDDEMDFNREKKKDRKRNVAELRLDALWKINQTGSFLLFEPSYTYFDSKSETGVNETDTYSRLSRLYLYWNTESGLSFQFGRQDFDEEREWLYDEILDAIRIRYRTEDWHTEFSLSKGREFYDEPNETENINNIMFDARYYINPSHFFSAWFIHRDDQTERKFSPSLIGLRSISKARKGFRHWVDFALANGEAGDDSIEGYGFDLGLGHITRGKTRAYGALSIAYGSASSAGNFRQSGLQGNADKLSGLVSYRYYGELMNPELSNLMIYSVFLGTRPVSYMSFDIAAHYYAQVRKATELVDTKLKADPNGESEDLGFEFDVIAAYRKQQTTFQLIMGWFEPGNAFEKQDRASIIKLKLESKF